METLTSFNHYVPPRILFGAGKLNELAKLPLPGRKALIIISRGKSTRANGYLDRVQALLDQAGVPYAVFDRIQANPTSVNVDDGAAFANANDCDFLIALGGGSVMDAAKGIAVVAANGGKVWDYIVFGSGKGQPMTRKPLPIVAITTTAGTGSEVDCGAVISNEETHEKTGLLSEEIYPAIGIVDPELMTSVPPEFTAYQGFDALFHSVEGYVSNQANLMSDMYAITAIALIGENLARAVIHGDDLTAREKVAFANTLSGFVMCVGACNSEHALEHALSAYHPDLPHGAGLIMISKAYYSLLIERHVADERFIRMAQALGMADAKTPQDFIRMLDRLQRACGVAELKMSDYGIGPDEFEKMAKNAESTMGFLFTCDRTPITVADRIAIYRKSYR